MRLLTVVTLLLLLAPASPAQERVYGVPAELKGLKRIYVEAGPRERGRIVEALRKSKTGVEVVDAPGAAELILQFTADKVTSAAGWEKKRDVWGNPTGEMEPKYGELDAGYGSAYVPLAGGGRRVLFTWKGMKKLFASPARKFVSAFVKEYRKANGLM